MGRQSPQKEGYNLVLTSSVYPLFLRALYLLNSSPSSVKISASYQNLKYSASKGIDNFMLAALAAI